MYNCFWLRVTVKNATFNPNLLTFEFKKYKSEEVKYFCERNDRVIAHHHAIPTLIWSNLGNVVIALYYEDSSSPSLFSL